MAEELVEEIPREQLQRWKLIPPFLKALEDEKRRLGGAVLHFTPASSSWMNLVERFFRDLTKDVVREGSFKHVRELAAAIEAYLAERDLHPKRYVWKAEGKAILEKISRARRADQPSML